MFKGGYDDLPAIIHPEFSDKRHSFLDCQSSCRIIGLLLYFYIDCPIVRFGKFQRFSQSGRFFTFVCLLIRERDISRFNLFKGIFNVEPLAAI